MFLLELGALVSPDSVDLLLNSNAKENAQVAMGKRLAVPNRSGVLCNR